MGRPRKTGPKLLTVRFEVADELAAVPSRLHLGLARPGQTVRRRVKLVANVQRKMGLAQAERSADVPVPIFRAAPSHQHQRSPPRPGA